jgi:hypothetical protein
MAWCLEISINNNNNNEIRILINYLLQTMAWCLGTGQPSLYYHYYRPIIIIIIIIIIILHLISENFNEIRIRIFADNNLSKINCCTERFRSNVNVAAVHGSTIS